MSKCTLSVGQVFYFEIINVIFTKFKDFVVLRMISEFHFLVVNGLVLISGVILGHASN